MMTASSRIRVVEITIKFINLKQDLLFLIYISTYQLERSPLGEKGEPSNIKSGKLGTLF